jgi:hypothetical protein
VCSLSMYYRILFCSNGKTINSSASASDTIRSMIKNLQFHSAFVVFRWDYRRH